MYGLCRTGAKGPTFHPLPSLLNVIDYKSESETDKTAHIRKRLHASANARDHRLHASHPKTPHAHTHTVTQTT